MTITQFPKDNISDMRRYITQMEDIVLRTNQDMAKAGQTEHALYQMGRVAMSADNVANAMRTMIKELDDIEKILKNRR